MSISNKDYRKERCKQSHTPRKPKPRCYDDMYGNPVAMAEFALKNKHKPKKKR